MDSIGFLENMRLWFDLWGGVISGIVQIFLLIIGFLTLLIISIQVFGGETVKNLKIIKFAIKYWNTIPIFLGNFFNLWLCIFVPWIVIWLQKKEINSLNSGIQNLLASETTWAFKAEVAKMSNERVIAQLGGVVLLQHNIKMCPFCENENLEKIEASAFSQGALYGSIKCLSCKAVLKDILKA